MESHLTFSVLGFHVMEHYPVETRSDPNLPFAQQIGDPANDSPQQLMGVKKDWLLNSAHPGRNPKVEARVGFHLPPKMRKFA